MWLSIFTIRPPLTIHVHLYMTVKTVRAVSNFQCPYIIIRCQHDRRPVNRKVLTLQHRYFASLLLLSCCTRCPDMTIVTKIKRRFVLSQYILLLYCYRNLVTQNGFEWWSQTKFHCTYTRWCFLCGHHRVALLVCITAVHQLFCSLLKKRLLPTWKQSRHSFVCKHKE